MKTLKSKAVVTEDLQDELCTGILLPEDSELPVFVRVPKKVCSSEQKHCPEIVGANCQHMRPKDNSIKNRHLLLSRRELSSTDGSKSNKCVQKITRGQAGYDWRGPILVVKLVDLDAVLKNVVDMSPRDLEDIVDCLLKDSFN